MSAKNRYNLDLTLLMTDPDRLHVRRDLAGFAEMLRSRSRYLKGHDRELMGLVYEQGLNVAQIARLMKVNATSLRRRVRRLSELLIEGEYVFFLRNIRLFEPIEQHIIRDRYLEQHSIEIIAVNRQTTVYRVRETLRKIRRLYDTRQRRGRLAAQGRCR